MEVTEVLLSKDEEDAIASLICIVIFIFALVKM